jgi:type IV secretion system protein VirD4
VIRTHCERERVCGDARTRTGVFLAFGQVPWKPPNQTSSEHITARDLMTPDKIMRLPGGALILLSSGQRPTVPLKLRYFCDPEFRTLFDPS